jgi:uridine kinase
MNFVNEVPHIFITGIPASGKSTLAYQLSQTTGLPWVELDTYFPKLNTGEYDKLTPQAIILALHRSSIVEGVQLMELKASTLKGLVCIVDASNDVILHRYVASGAWSNLSADDQKIKIIDVVSRFRKRLQEFQIS